MTHQPQKRLVLCCDGTWNDSISTSNPLTNVARFARCVEDRPDDGILQIVYYHTGVGSGTSAISNSIDGAIGRGISSNIRNAYSFICHNFNFTDAQDEIFLVGFSRGAFTVRCVASLIEDIGLLTKPGLSRLYDVYSLWEQQDPFKNKNRLMDPLTTLVTELEEENLLKRRVKVAACAAWDTVSSLGVQITFRFLPRLSKKLAFVNRTVPSVVENAFHALALNERRRNFQPLLWDHPPAGINFKQCWFIGSHSDIGGGYNDAGLANITLVWMIAQFQKFTRLSFNVKYLLQFLVTNEVVVKKDGYPFYHKLHAHIPFSGIRLKSYVGAEKMKFNVERGKAANSLTTPWRILGARAREPGGKLLLYKTQHGTGITSAEDDLGVTVTSASAQGIPVGEISGRMNLFDHENKPYEPLSSQETIHFTVRLMTAKKFQDCPVLTQHVTVVTQGEPPKVVWMPKPEDQQPKGDTTRPKIGQINEAEVTEEERELLRLWLQEWAETEFVYSHRSERKFLVSYRRQGFSMERETTHITGQEVRIKLANLKEWDETPREGLFRQAETLREGLFRQAYTELSKALATFLYLHLEELNSPSLMYTST